MLNCIMVEDERLAREKLQLYINEHADLRLVASFASGEEFLQKSKGLKYELLLLDIGLPNIDGITLAGSLPKECRIIFTTAYAEYAVEAFNLNAIDYLLKPFDFERFSTAIEKAHATNPLQVPTIPTDSKISIKEGTKIHRLAIHEIIYIKGLKEYVVWHTAKGQLVTLHSLSHIRDYLKPYDFIQTHRSYIVNAPLVNVIEYGFVYLDQVQIPIGRSYRDQIRARFKGEI